MVMNHVMCTSKVLKERKKTKNTFIKLAYSVLVVKMCL